MYPRLFTPHRKLPQRQKAWRRRDSYSRGDGSDQDDARSSASHASSRRSVDSVLIEHFSGSDSGSNPSQRGSQSSASDFEPSRRSGPFSAIQTRLNLVLIKRRARRLLKELINAAKGEDEPTAARLQRSSAAEDLVIILEEEPDGDEIVARRFVKKASRKAEGTRALLKLSDDELDKFRYEDIDTGFKTTPSRKLLGAVLEHSNESSFFKETLSPLMEDGTEGAAAILYLALEHARNFFPSIGGNLIFDFCKRAVNTQEILSPKWCCAGELLCILLTSSDRDKREDRTLGQFLLSMILKPLIQTVIEERKTVITRRSKYSFVFRGVPVLPLLAACCKTIQGNAEMEELARSTLLNSFLMMLLGFVFPRGPGSRRLGRERGLGLYILISFLKIPSVAQLFLDVGLYRFTNSLVDMVLRRWTLEFEVATAFEKEILKPLSAKGDLYITCLCSLPPSTFSIAMSAALEKGMVQLDSPKASSPYEPLGLVEHLLSLSNSKMMGEQIHRALVDGSACEFLAHSLDYSGGLDASDRGLWRAKGLAMTCLGNLVERMDKEQFCNRIKKEMITRVIAIKEDGEVPLVQKGQAIFLLQRYTLAADRLGVQPFHREAPLSTAEDARIVEDARMAEEAEVAEVAQMAQNARKIQWIRRARAARMTEELRMV
ncbi:hypothetical protein FS837_012614 [Tulasnella sp. UAMH 9824]|nr:hypothetical protein FS837_012614 [Tulasnella sp. UAMH 9824]